MEQIFNTFLITMSIIAAIVFVALYFVEAGYGMLYTKKWGASIPNRWGWVLMESPVFLAMTLLWILSDRASNPVCLCFFIFFQAHYLQRAFIFPFLIKGKSRMPLSIVSMGVLFNFLNALMQGGWIFYIAPNEMYNITWLYSWQFIIGAVIFITGMVINIHSDYIIRSLRKPGDKNHYLPQRGVFRYVSSANYFGELTQWIGFAIMTWSWAGVVFALWTFANLTPRAAALNKKYAQKFPEEFKKLNPKRIIPFIY